MTFKNTLLLAASAVALLGSVQFTVAQTSVVTTDAFTTDDTTRLKAETARLYASTIARITQAIEDDISADATDSIIAGLRTGDLSVLTSVSAATLDLAEKLKIQALVLDVTDGTVSEDLRIAVFVRDGALSQGVTRANIESAARDLGDRSLVRFQNGEIIGASGAVSIPTSAGIAAIEGVGTWVGVSSKAKITSRGTGTEEVQVLACASGFYGTGIVQQRHNDRTTTLGGVVVDEFDDWIELSRSCSAEYSEQVRIFGACAGPDGLLDTPDDNTEGQSLYEVTQFVRKHPTDPFGFEIFRDLTTATLADAAGCVSSDRIAGAADFLVNGRTDGLFELRLKTNISPVNVGNGPGTVPEEISTDGTSTPVSTIPFPVTSERDFNYIRPCWFNYRSVAAPAGFTKNNPGFFGGNVTFYRDYNRRETYFSDNRREYILNYDVVLDPNPYGHASKGRGRLPEPVIEGLSPAYIEGNRNDIYGPSTDGWYHYTENCQRSLYKVENEIRIRNCSDHYPDTYPNGLIRDAHVGKGIYRQTTPRNPEPNGPTLQSIVWEDWAEPNPANQCYKVTVEDKVEARTRRRGNCRQNQTRTATVTTRTYQDGRSTSTTRYRTDSAPEGFGHTGIVSGEWTDSGPVYDCPVCCSGGCHDEDPRPRCKSTGSGGSDSGGNGGEGNGPTSIDVDGDGIGDFSSTGAARDADYGSGTSVEGDCGSCDGPGPSGDTGGGGDFPG